MRVFSVSLILVLLTLAGCSTTEPRERTTHDRKVLTRAQLDNSGRSNVYEAVQALRGNWLTTRGRDSFQSSGGVIVYLDGTLLGGVNALRSIQIASVSSIRYYDSIEAGATFGLDHGQGVIAVSTLD